MYCSIKPYKSRCLVGGDNGFPTVIRIKVRGVGGDIEFKFGGISAYEVCCTAQGVNDLRIELGFLPMDERLHITAVFNAQFLNLNR